MPFARAEPPEIQRLTLPVGPPPYLGEPKETYQVFVFGDSLAAGLFAGMSRMADGDLRLSVDGRFKDDSGLARPEFYDWAAALPKIQERRQIDIAVIFLGSNDGQDMRSATSVIAFETPDWATTYARRMDQIIEILRSKGSAVYWVELPPMGPEPLEAETKFVATVQGDRVKKAKIRYVETRKAFADDKDHYTDQGTDVNGTAMRLRSRDGIHFLKSGNDKLAQLVLDVIRQDIDVADGKVASAEGAAPPDEAAQAVPEEVKPSLPLFGQLAGSREEEQSTLFPADQTWASAVLAVNRGIRGGQKSDNLATPQTVLTALRERVAPDSLAGQLLIDGKWPETKEGRYDDFRWPDGR